ncbi:MAG: phosphatase [Cutibacterium granulosum]|nr:MAG: phosphatase [Cutibacterium granulosum]
MSAADLAQWVSRRFQAVLFDFDGTLVNSTSAVERSWRQWVHEFGVEAAALHHGVPVIETVNAVIDPDRRPEALARIRQLELGATDGIVLAPGGRDAVAGLDDRTCAIVTSCDRDLFEKRCGLFEGLAVPSVTITRTDVEHGKPDPEPWLAAAERLHVDPRECLVVEDSEAGLVSGKAAGCATLGLLTTLPIERIHADVVVPDLSQVQFVRDETGVMVRPR